MKIRKSTIFLIAAGCIITGVTALLLIQPQASGMQSSKATETNAGVVRRLELTDLCLFTEARYTRHLSQADLNSAFQDYPLAFDLFPSGSLVRPLPVFYGKQ